MLSMLIVGSPVRDIPSDAEPSSAVGITIDRFRAYTLMPMDIRLKYTMSDIRMELRCLHGYAPKTRVLLTEPPYPFSASVDTCTTCADYVSSPNELPPLVDDDF